ncbi:hypothetical protein [Rhodobacter ferrooxidans]|uniref:hypothetical protein n=1 Tax=Rhodobacter ferrooxidans TaxID=371731 RepID=UPI0012E9A97F|nr:hypothetical protein [Rhodobacter sp. SW2]
MEVFAIYIMGLAGNFTACSAAGQRAEFTVAVPCDVRIGMALSIGAVPNGLLEPDRAPVGDRGAAADGGRVPIHEASFVGLLSDLWIGPTNLLPDATGTGQCFAGPIPPSARPAQKPDQAGPAQSFIAVVSVGASGQSE